jgi:hypothetical protein
VREPMSITASRKSNIILPAPTALYRVFGDDDLLLYIGIRRSYCCQAFGSASPSAQAW